MPTKMGFPPLRALRKIRIAKARISSDAQTITASYAMFTLCQTRGSSGLIASMLMT